MELEEGCIELHPDLKAVNQSDDELERLRARVAELEADQQRVSDLVNKAWADGKNEGHGDATAEASVVIGELRTRVAELEKEVESSSEMEVLRYCERQWQEERAAFFKRIAELEAERAELEKQVPVAWYIDGEDGREYNGTPKMSDGRSGTPIYADPPVAAPVLLTSFDIWDLFQAWNMNPRASHADLIISVETAVLRANGFKVEV